MVQTLRDLNNQTKKTVVRHIKLLTDTNPFLASKQNNQTFVTHFFYVNVFYYLTVTLSKIFVLFFYFLLILYKKKKKKKSKLHLPRKTTLLLIGSHVIGWVHTQTTGQKR